MGLDAVERATLVVVSQGRRREPVVPECAIEDRRVRALKVEARGVCVVHVYPRVIEGAIGVAAGVISHIDAHVLGVVELAIGDVWVRVLHVHVYALTVVEGRIDNGGVGVEYLDPAPDGRPVGELL